jgi:hypothetical protein
MAKITRMRGPIEVWRVEIGDSVTLALSPEEALDSLMSQIEEPAVRVEWVNVPQDFDPPGWDGRFPRLPPSATA